MSDRGTPTAWLRSGLVRGLIGFAVVSAAFAWALPSFAPYRAVWDELGRVSTRPAILLAGIGMLNLVAPATVQRAALPGLRLGDAVASDWATSALTNTVPGGSALAIGVTWSMYRSFGLGRREIARSVLVTGALDTFVKLGTPLLALIWLSAERPVGPRMVQAAIAGGVLFGGVVALCGLLLAGPAAAHRVGSMLDRLRIGRGDWPARLAGLREDTVGFLKDRWTTLTFWMLIGHANLFVLLAVSLRAVGVTSTELSLAAILAAFAFGRLVTALPLTPGGLGVMEVGLTGALAAVGSSPQAAIVAAVLLFRFLSFVLPIPLGAISWLAWTSRPKLAGTAR